MAQPLVLAIEPDLRQATIVKRIVKEKALADVTVVDSRDAAIEAMRTTMPDVLLLSALLSPRDEDELITHLKTLDNAGHLQTHTIPQLASALGPGEERASRGLLSAFRRKKDPGPTSGCDPDLFAEEIRVYLQRAADKKRDLQNVDRVVPDMRPSAVQSTRAAAEKAEQPADESSASSSWSSPFEWKPASTPARAARSAPEPPPVAKAPERPAPLVSEPGGVAAGPLVDNFTASRSFLPDDAGPAPAPLVQPAVPEPVVVAPLIVEPTPVTITAPEPVVVARLAPEPVAPTIPTPEPVVLAPLAPEPVAPRIPAPEPVVVAPVAAEPIARPAPVPAPPPAPAPVPVAAKPATPEPVAAKPPSPEPVRLKPVAERAAQITARVQLQEIGRAARAAKAREAEDRLGPLARWARIETPRPTKHAPVTSDDVRRLIASLAVPTAIASVRYPRGCRIRRVRVPASPDVDSSEVGPVILSKRALAEQREKQAPA